MEHESLTDQLLKQFVHQKTLLLERHGVTTMPSLERMRAVLLPHMGKAAELVQEWCTDPGLLVEAAFARARRDKHPDGPLPAMLGSQKYMLRALSLHLDVPEAAVRQAIHKTTIVKKLEEAFHTCVESMRLVGGTDDEVIDKMFMLTSHPLEYRFVFALASLRPDAAKELTGDLLPYMARNRAVEMWLESHGFSYESVAKFHNA